MQDKYMDIVEEWFVAYHDVLVYLCMRYFMYQSQFIPFVDDCIQEVFLRALRKADKLVAHPNPYGWLANACKKQCKSIMRKKAIRRNIVGEAVPYDEQINLPSLQDDITRWINKEDTSQLLHAVFDKLTPSEQIVYSEYFEKEKTAPEIASEQGTSVTAIRGAIQRIRKKASRIFLLLIMLGQFSLIVLCSI